MDWVKDHCAEEAFKVVEADEKLQMALAKVRVLDRPGTHQRTNNLSSTVAGLQREPSRDHQESGTHA